MLGQVLLAWLLGLPGMVVVTAVAATWWAKRRAHDWDVESLHSPSMPRPPPLLTPAAAPECLSPSR